MRHVGERACYVVDEDGFLRHIDAAQVDKQVLDFLMGQVDQHRDLAVSGMMDLMGKDDIFTKAAVESSIDNIDQAVGQAIPEQSRQWLGMMGFRVIINDQARLWTSKCLRGKSKRATNTDSGPARRENRIPSPLAGIRSLRKMPVGIGQRLVDDAAFHIAGHRYPQHVA